MGKSPVLSAEVSNLAEIQDSFSRAERYIGEAQTALANIGSLLTSCYAGMAEPVYEATLTKFGEYLKYLLHMTQTCSTFVENTSKDFVEADKASAQNIKR